MFLFLEFLFEEFWVFEFCFSIWETEKRTASMWLQWNPLILLSIYFLRFLIQDMQPSNNLLDLKAMNFNIFLFKAEIYLHELHGRKSRSEKVRIEKKFGAGLGSKIFKKLSESFKLFYKNFKIFLKNVIFFLKVCSESIL